METFWVYILYSTKLDRYYIGSTGDLARRLAEHERGKTAYSRQGFPWVLKYSEAYPSRSEAYRTEMELKGWKSRKRIESLIGAGAQQESGHPAYGGRVTGSNPVAPTTIKKGITYE